MEVSRQLPEFGIVKSSSSRAHRENNAQWHHGDSLCCTNTCLI